MEIAEWIAWGLAFSWTVLIFVDFLMCVFGPGRPEVFYLSINQLWICSGFHFMALMAALVTTTFWDVSKLHLLWFVPVFSWLVMKRWGGSYFIWRSESQQLDDEILKQFHKNHNDLLVEAKPLMEKFPDLKQYTLTEAQKLKLKKLLTKELTRAERLIIILYYYEEMPIKQIAEVLDISEERVSQIHSSIIARLKAKMNYRKATFECMKTLQHTGKSRSEAKKFVRAPKNKIVKIIVYALLIPAIILMYASSIVESEGYGFLSFCLFISAILVITVGDR